jgi:hypothetical protein
LRSHFTLSASYFFPEVKSALLSTFAAQLKYMTKHFLPAIALLLLSITGYAATGDTTIIVAHANSNLASPPSNDDEWIVFPNTATTYQKIIMKFTLGCGTPNCSGWDYTVNASLGKKNGAIDTAIVAIDTLTLDTTWSYSDHVNFMEMGRLITPYGTYMAGNSNGFNSSWTHPYYYDLTDYAALLKDSVNVRVHYDGWTDAFSAKVEFIFVEGPPTRTVENIQEIYNAYYGYGNSTDFENQVTEKTFSISPNVTSAKVSVNMTGHGSQGEFDPHYFHIKINGSEIYQHILWKQDCDLNPIAPQGGTWIFARANWCPGERVPIYEIDITPFITPGQSVTVDLDFDDFAIQSGAAAGYGISAHLITYTAQKNNDVMMEEIIAPNNDKTYLHWNPICTQPKIKIKNTGKQPLTYAEIKYWVKGGNYWYYEWQGNLPPFESEIITLPAFDWFGLDTNDRRFYAEAKWPNQVPDEYTFNNKLESSFNMTPKMDSVFTIYFRTNNRPEENWYLVQNEAGDTISYKTTFAAATTYKDTLQLAPGSYVFDMYDYDGNNWGCGDGLKFFLNQQDPPCPNGSGCYETTGQINLRKLNNTVIKNFTSEFGANIHYEFTVGYSLGFNTPKTAPTEPVHTDISEVQATANMLVFPNPAGNLLNIQIDINEESDGIIELTDVSGRTVRTVHVDNSTHHTITLPTAELSKGLYFVNFTSQAGRICKRVVVQ